MRRQSRGHGRQVASNGFDGQFAGFDLGKVENVVEDGDQRLRGVLRHQQLLARFGILSAVQHQADHADDTVHGGADLMAHVGQELALQASGFLGALFGGAQLHVDPLAFDNLLFELGIARARFRSACC